MLKKLIPVLLAVAVFVAGWFLLQPEPNVKAVGVIGDLAAGHVLAAEDLRWVYVPQSRAPADAVLDPRQAIGQPLKTDRSAGDVLRAIHFGQPAAGLAANERAVAVRVTDSSGLAGLLKPGDLVGLTAIIAVQEGAYSKATIEKLRVLYVDPGFRSGYAETNRAAGDDGTQLTTTRERKTSGPVVLAVPVAAQAVQYSNDSGTPEVRQVNAIELLAALDAAQNCQLSLYAMPAEAEAFTSAGLFVPDLVVRATPTPTPSPTPENWKPTPATPTPTPKK